MVYRVVLEDLYGLVWSLGYKEKATALDVAEKYKGKYMRQRPYDGYLIYYTDDISALYVFESDI